LTNLRFTPGAAALIGVTVLCLSGLLGLSDLWAALQLQWRPLLALTCIMVMTGVVQEVGAFERLAQWIEAHAHSTSATRTFSIVFTLSVVTASLLNNDAAILLLTPLVVALSRRLYPGRTAVTEAFAFAVFLAPGVAPFVISNPMNMIVAEYAGVGFYAYAKLMAPISLAGAALTYAVLRLRYREDLVRAEVAREPITWLPPRPGERAAVTLLIAVFCAYPIMAAAGGQIWIVALTGALASMAIAWRYRIAPPRKVFGHVSPDILVFLWGVFLVVSGLRQVGVVDRLAGLYGQLPPGSAHEVGVVGVVSALGSAVVDNHPMALLNMMALDCRGGVRPLMAALVGGDIGPRLLPIGSLAGLLWMDLLRRSGVEIRIGTFVRLGTFALLPTLTVSLIMLRML
jgi:arsenical pump membrane protein